MSAARAALLVLAGLVIGTWSAMCGIGGGVFAVPLLHYGFGLRLKTAVGSSLLLVAASTTSATLGELTRIDSTLHWGAAGALIVASFGGARVGFLVAQRLDGVQLKAVFAVLLACVATYLLLRPGGPQTASAADVTALSFTPLDYLAIAGIGFAAGFVAPLLGVGGGLVAVPALLLGFPALGFLGARAASMAMSLFTSWQSTWLYQRAREVAFAFAAWLALGALAGGWIGVALVHVEGATAVAHALLAITLYLVAARFAWDVAAARRVDWGPRPRP